MINDDKYLNELREQLAEITNKKSIVDKQFYSDLAYKIRNESDEGISELLAVIKETDKNISNDMAGSILSLHDAFMLFEANGFPHLAKKMLVIMSILSTLTESTDKYIDVILRAQKSKAKKGKTNRHHTEALRIAAKTWDKYPNASLAGLSEDIYSHLRKSWKDVPVMGTVKNWLKDSGLNPDVKPKNRNYKLITSEGE